MRILCALALMATLSPAQSHPSWWNWASPDATALVGVRWETAQGSPLAQALADEIGPDGGLGIPGLESLKQSKQFVLSSPPFLAIASGDFNTEDLHRQAAAQSMKIEVYKGVEILISPGKSTLSVARISDHLLLLGFRRTLEAAVDNSLAADRRYSALLKRAARFSGQDLWVVASQLPDSLASRFVPLEVEARGFEGSVNLTDGIRLEGTLAEPSPDDAAGITAHLRQLAASLPPVARGLQVVAAGDMVVLTMAASREQVAANLRTPSPPAQPEQPVLPKVQVAAKVAEQPAAPIPPAALAKAAPVPVAPPVPVQPVAALTPPAPPAPAGPRVVRILGLDEGTREIPLPPLSR